MLKVGDKAPEFSLVSDEGKRVSLADYRGQRVILYFYPRDMTPGCTAEACDFRDNMNRLSAKGAVVLGISADSEESHAKFKKKKGLNFPLLADEDGTVCRAYGVWKPKSFFGKILIGPTRTTFIVSPSGTIEKIFQKVKVKGHADAVLRDLEALSSAPS